MSGRSLSRFFSTVGGSFGSGRSPSLSRASSIGSTRSSLASWGGSEASSLVNHFKNRLGLSEEQAVQRVTNILKSGKSRIERQMKIKKALTVLRAGAGRGAFMAVAAGGKGVRAPNRFVRKGVFGVGQKIAGMGAARYNKQIAALNAQNNAAYTRLRGLNTAQERELGQVRAKYGRIRASLQSNINKRAASKTRLQGSSQTKRTVANALRTKRNSITYSKPYWRR